MSGEAPDVAVVVPTRNRSTLLDRLLRQLVALDGGLRYEVVVVDEGSSDDTPALLARYAAEHGVRVVRHDVPRGLSGARNAGFDASTARYVAWIDDDDLTAPDRLARQHAALVAGEARWSCAGRVDVDDDLRVIGHVRCPSLGGLMAELLQVNVIPSAGQGLLVERELAQQVGPYDETLTSAEDWDYAIRLLEAAPPHLLDEPLVGYRTGVESMSTDTGRMEREISKVIAKHDHLYRRFGVEPDWGRIHQSLLTADLLGSPAQARRRAFRSFRAGPSLGSLRKLVAVSLAPRWYEERSRQRREEQVPEEWRRQARAWLDGVSRPAAG